MDILSDHWDDGSKVLRSLGVPVPVELPATSILEYVADQHVVSADENVDADKRGEVVSKEALGLWNYRLEVAKSRQKFDSLYNAEKIASGGGGVGGVGGSRGSVGLGGDTVVSKPEVIRVRIRIPSVPSTRIMKATHP